MPKKKSARSSRSARKRVPKPKPDERAALLEQIKGDPDALAALLGPEFQEWKQHEARRSRGRPTLYSPDYAHIARLYCERTGATDAELAELFNVCEATINLWKKVYPDFSESIKKGKAPVDDEVEQALLSRALGYSHPDVHVSVIDKAVVLTDLVKHYPPSEVAAIFWLKNRRPEKWREKSTVEHEGLSLEQLVAGARKLPDPPAGLS